MIFLLSGKVRPPYEMHTGSQLAADVAATVGCKKSCFHSFDRVYKLATSGVNTLQPGLVRGKQTKKFSSILQKYTIFRTFSIKSLPAYC